MSNINFVKTKVREFQKKTGSGRGDYDSFAPWWLQQKFGLSDEEATSKSSDGNYDHGIDGYNVKASVDSPAISIIQAKFTDNIKDAQKGILDIKRFLPQLKAIIIGQELPNIAENYVVRKLRSEVQKLIELTTTDAEIKVELWILHLTALEWEVVENRCKSSIDELNREIKKVFASFPNITFSLQPIGLSHLLPNEVRTVIRVDPKIPLRFDGSKSVEMFDSFFWSGVGKLSDLVSLYESRGNQIFSRNVRYFLFKKQEKGAANKIKETLRKICEDHYYPPERFAFLHNGVTVYAANIEKKGGLMEIQSPAILNGCQTIKSAYIFYQDALEKKTIDLSVWDAIPITIRIVKSTDDILWRDVAESNNRQTAMRPSALRANDEIQIELQNRFKEIDVYYERQEEAYENLTPKELSEFEENYPNIQGPVYIESLARAIVCASDLSISNANHINDLFDSQSTYLKVFSTKHLANLRFLVFLHNLLGIIHLSTKDVIPENTKKYYGFKPNSFKYTILRLVVKTIIKRGETQLIDDYGISVLKKTSLKELRNIVASLIRSKEYPILKTIGDLWASGDGSWANPTDPNLNKRALAYLNLQNIDVFDKVSSL